MKIHSLWLGLLVASITSVTAQVTVEVKQEQEQFLPGETLQVMVRITNRSGQTLRLGGEEDWLTFSIESRDGMVVPKVGEAPVKGEFTLQSSKVAIKRVDLVPYFTFPQPGRYGITATVRIKDWGREISSLPKYFDIIEGAKLWEQEVGVPKTAGATNDVPEVRKYILQQANYLKGQIRLYLRVTDPYGKLFRVFPIGPMVSFGRPDPQVDKFSHLHVLYQNGPLAFSYTIFNLDGDVLVHQTYDYINTRPRLHDDGEGNISVTGGLRRVAASDVPAPKPESESDDASKPAVSADSSPRPANPTNEVSTPKP